MAAELPARAWTANQLAFQVWLAMPPDLRQPRQQKQLAQQFGVREATLSDWKHEPGFGDEVTRLALELVKSDWIGRIIASQAHKAVYGGDTDAARLVLSVAGLLGNSGDSKGVTVNVGVQVREIVGFNPGAV